MTSDTVRGREPASSAHRPVARLRRMYVSGRASARPVRPGIRRAHPTRNTVRDGRGIRSRRSAQPLRDGGDHRLLEVLTDGLPRETRRSARLLRIGGRLVRPIRRDSDSQRTSPVPYLTR